MEHLVLLIGQYGYIILFPLAVFEGPISTIIAGFFVSLGALNPVLVYIVMMTGDIIGDSLCYGIGRWAWNPFFNKIGYRLGITREDELKVKRYFETHGHKTIALSKIIHGIGVTGLFVAGSLRVSYKKYITTCFLVTLVQTAVFLVIGILFGQAYIQLNRYLNYFASATVTLGILTLLLFIIAKRFKIRIKP